MRQALRHIGVARTARYAVSVAAAAGCVLAAGPAAAQTAGTGTISGRVISDTGGLGGTGTVQLFSADCILQLSSLVRPGGIYSVPDVQPGDYKLSFRVGGRTQWAHQKLNCADADTFAVVADQNTVVDEVLLPLGTLSVSVTDASTGQPVDAVCGDLVGTSARHACADHGVLTFTNGDPTPLELTLEATDGLHQTKVVTGIEVPLASHRDLAVAMVPTSAVTATVTDRQTGQPVPFVCVIAVTLRFGALKQDACHAASDSTGNVLIGQLPADTYTLLVVPHDGHGMQWVGVSGGTGDQYRARQLSTTVGRSLAAGTILLDPAASIGGSLFDAVTGELIRDGNACASVLPMGEDFGVGGRACVDADGHYLLDGVGPYAWPVEFGDIGFVARYARQWSGDAGNRMDARKVLAAVAQPTTLNARLLASGRVTGWVLDATGAAHQDSVFVTAYDAVTGDFAAETEALFGTYALVGVGNQTIRISYRVPLGPLLWYRHAAAFCSADPVRAHAGRTRAGVDLVL
jgi:hypothetical protein